MSGATWRKGWAGPAGGARAWERGPRIWAWLCARCWRLRLGPGSALCQAAADPGPRGRAGEGVQSEQPLGLAATPPQMASAQLLSLGARLGRAWFRGGAGGARGVCFHLVLTPAFCT